MALIAAVSNKNNQKTATARLIERCIKRHSITTRNFDRNAAQNPQSPNGYLGIRIPQERKVALLETSQTGAVAGAASASGGTNTGGPSYWSTLGASTSALAGKTSTFYEKEGKSFTVFLSESAKQGDTITLSLAGSASGLKAVLGDSTVNADGAVITLVEGQVQASFSLVSDAGISADQVGALAVKFDSNAFNADPAGGGSQGVASKRSNCKHYRKRSVLRPYDADIGCISSKFGCKRGLSILGARYA